MKTELEENLETLTAKEYKIAIKGLSRTVVDIVRSSDNDYDAVDELNELLTNVFDKVRENFRSYEGTSRV